MREFAVGELLDVGDIHFDDRSQIPRKCRPEISPESFVQRFERPHLILGNPLGPLEIIGLNVEMRSEPPAALPPPPNTCGGVSMPTCPLSTAASRASTSDCSSTSAKSDGLLADTIHYRTFG